MNGPALAMSFASLGSEAARTAVASAGSYGSLRVGPERVLGMLRVCHASRCRGGWVDELYDAGSEKSQEGLRFCWLQESAQETHSA